jgi:hypothetical protein
VEAHCPRCGAGLAADAVECPVCAYGEVEEIVILEAQPPGTSRSEPGSPSTIPRVLVAVAFLIVVIVVIAALR